MCQCNSEISVRRRAELELLALPSVPLHDLLLPLRGATNCQVRAPRQDLPSILRSGGRRIPHRLPSIAPEMIVLGRFH